MEELFFMIELFTLKYIDKTKFIREWWESGDEVTLITRPRRFGKTLNMSMVEKFCSIQYAGRGDLFEGLSIWQEKSSDGEYTYRKMQGSYPVLERDMTPAFFCMYIPRQKIFPAILKVLQTDPRDPRIEWNKIFPPCSYLRSCRNALDG